MEQRPHQLESDEDQAEGMTIQLGPVEYPKIWGGTIKKKVAYFYLSSVSTSANVKVGHLPPRAHQFRRHCKNPKTNLLIENGDRSLYDHTNETILFISIRMYKYLDQPNNIIFLSFIAQPIRLKDFSVFFSLYIFICTHSTI